MTNSDVLLAHEWLERTGGSENTFEQMIKVLPDARVACLWNNSPERFPTAEESWLGRTKLRNSKATSLFFMSSAWRKLDLSSANTVVSSSHAFSHHLAGRAAREGRRAIAYVYSPARYIWAPDLDARGQGALASIARPALKSVDRKGIHPNVRYVGISKYVSARMRDVWGVDAEVLYPPVDTRRVTEVADWSRRLTGHEAEIADNLPDEFVLGASRMVEYKRLDLAIRAGESVGIPVVIAGRGPMEGRLREIASSARIPVQFVGEVSDALLYTLYQRTQLFVFMAIEDFGIMPVEAMALGARTLLRDVGGTNEISVLLNSGATADPSSTSALASHAREALEMPKPDAAVVRSAFSVESFRANFADLVQG